MKKITKKIPKTPGVYFFKNGARKIIYIGKAANLKNRLSSYFRKNLEPRIAKMVVEAKTVSWKKTESAVDALILESALIKKHKPKYNVLMRDDKNYFFAGFTRDEFPKIFLTHQPVRQLPTTHHQPLTNYIGPFTDGGSLKSALHLLRKAFPYCSCFEEHSRPCLRAHLGRCVGVCCLRKKRRAEFFSSAEVKKAKKDYLSGISRIKKILLGRRKSILKNLKKEMKKAAVAGYYEKAAEIRDKISALESVFAHAGAVSDFLKKRTDGRRIMEKDFRKFFGLDFPARIEIYDISNISGKFAVGAMVVFENGKPCPKEYRRFKIRGEQEPNDPKMMKEMIERRLRRDDWPAPDLMIIDGGAGQLSAVLPAIKTWKPRFQVKIIAIAKGLEEVYRSDGKKVFLSSLNNETRLFLERTRDEAHRFAVKYHREIRTNLF